MRANARRLRQIRRRQQLRELPEQLQQLIQERFELGQELVSLPFLEHVFAAIRSDTVAGVEHVFAAVDSVDARSYAIDDERAAFNA